jgi:hypothetical protein
MGTISLRRALTEAKGFLVKDHTALGLYVVVGVVLPFMIHSTEPALSLRALLALALNSGAFLTGSITGPLYMFALMMLLFMAAQLGLWNAWLPEMRDGAVSELMFAFVAALGFIVVVTLASALASFPVGLLVGFVLTPLRLAGGGLEIAAAALQMLANFAFTTFLASRLWLVGPIMGATGSMNPASAMMASWRKTRPARGKLFLLYAGIGLVFGAIFAGLLALHAAIIAANPVDQDTIWERVMSPVWLIYWIIVFAVQCAIAAGLHRASEEGSASDVFA